jgi:hypothetical protein
MHVLLVTRGPKNEVAERWAKLGVGATQVSEDQFIDIVSDHLQLQQVTVDAIVFACDPASHLPEPRPPDILEPLAAALHAISLSELPETRAMPDGRRWSALPVLLLVAKADLPEAEEVAARLKADGYPQIALSTLSADYDYSGSVLKALVKRYRQEVLCELDNLGFVVTYEAGRYRLGPALKPRIDLIGYYYFGPADQRPDHFVTIDRDLIGIQLEIELFESLINLQAASEADFQRFFEEHPHFLSLLSMPLSHVQLRDGAGKLVVPDFILKPVVAAQRDSRWEVLDLKRPQASLIVGRGSRRRLSHEVMKAVRQLRDYGDYFADPRNTATVEQALGHQLRRPKLGVLIGRMVETDVEALEVEQSRMPDVRIITYDEILEQQKNLAS